MFEIGPALREARERRQLSYSQVEQDTKIRTRYLRALEDEEFGILPGPTYTKGFLRVYADYLGMEGQLFVDEFNSRHHDPRREPDREIYPKTRARQKHRARRESSLVMIALAAIVAIASLVFVAFVKSPDNTAQLPPTVPSTTPHTQPQAATTHVQTQKHHKKHHSNKPASFTVIMTASGNCWITARMGSKNGPDAKTVKGTDLNPYELLAGVTATVKTTKPLFLTVGAPGNLSMTVNGRQVTLPYGTVLKVTSTGVTAA